MSPQSTYWPAAGAPVSGASVVATLRGDRGVRRDRRCTRRRPLRHAARPIALGGTKMSMRAGPRGSRSQWMASGPRSANRSNRAGKRRTVRTLRSVRVITRRTATVSASQPRSPAIRFARRSFVLSVPSRSWTSETSVFCSSRERSVDPPASPAGRFGPARRKCYSWPLHPSASRWGRAVS